MKISRSSVGLAVLAARKAAGLTLADLAGVTGISTSSLSRVENGSRDLSFTEFVALAEAFKIDVEHFRTLVENAERSGAAAKVEQRSELARDLDALQRLAIEAAIEARTLHQA